jgi:Sec-independent protein translocase protein TatA
MARYWASKGVFTSVGEDSRTVTLHVLSKACFGQSFAFEGHDERQPTSASASFRFSLLTVMENALLLMALTPRFFTNPWLPLPRAWRRLGKACDEFRSHMSHFYNRELRALKEGGRRKEDYTLMAALVRASQQKPEEKEEGEKQFANLTEAEIYGNMFVFAFAGHDTTAHLLTYAVYVPLRPPPTSPPPIKQTLTLHVNQLLPRRKPLHPDLARRRTPHRARRPPTLAMGLPRRLPAAAALPGRAVRDAARQDARVRGEVDGRPRAAARCRPDHCDAPPADAYYSELFVRAQACAVLGG